MIGRNLSQIRAVVKLPQTAIKGQAAQKYLSTKQELADEASCTSLFSHYPKEAGFIRDSPYENITLTKLKLDQYVWNNFTEWETKIAVACGVTHREYTYAELRDHSAAFAVRLQQKYKPKQAAVLAVCLPNIPEFPIATLGAIEAGMIVTTVNPIYTPDEICRQLLDSDTRIMVTTCDRYETVRRGCEMAQRQIPIICIRTEHQNEAMPAGAIDFREMINPHGLAYDSLIHYDTTCEDIALLPYSSGTTGKAKGVQLSHRNLTAESDMLQAKLPDHPQTGIVMPTTATFQEVLPCVLPFFHIYGFTVTLISKLAMGSKLVTLPRFQPDTFLSAMERYKGTVLHLVPPIVIFLGHYDKVEPKHVESIRSVMSGAAPMGTPDAERFRARAPGVDFAQGYGLTETSPVVLVSLKTTNYATVGGPTPNTQAKIVDMSDPTNTGLGPNKVGELLVRGPQVMRGYLNNEQASKEMLIENGWLRTGDLAYYDDDNQFYIAERLKELIKVKGFQVPPAELEELLRDHPKVLDAAVVGVPHAIKGEVPRAFVTPKPNVQVTEAELKEFVAGKVAEYKRLEGGVQFLDTIPKNASGKILRRELKDKYC